MERKFATLLAVTIFSNVAFASTSLTLPRAIQILKAKNLEIKIAKLDQKIAKKDVITASGNHYGKVDLIQDFAVSDDAGNVFGFKITSREATYRDFGLAQYQADQGAIAQSNGNNQIDTPQEMQAVDAQNDKIYSELNYPDERGFYQSKIQWQFPIFTGFKISSYVDIMNAMNKMKSLEKRKTVNEKIYELKKSFYDMALLKSSIKNLSHILDNIDKLENMVKEMISVGYAKKVDLLEVRAKKGNVERLLMDMHLNERLLYHYISFLLNQKVTSIVVPSNTSVPMPKINSKLIIHNNVDIKRAEVGLRIRRAMLNVAKAEQYPMIGASIEYATADDDFIDSLADAGDDGAYTVGLRATWNLYNGGIDSANIEKAKIELFKTQTQVQLARKGIGLMIAKIKTEIKSENEKIISLEKELALVNEIYHNYEARYKEKLVSMSDVIIKQSEQIQKILKLQMVKNKRNERVFALEKLANGER